MSNPSRPLSPHIQIYKWQWSMIASITNRITSILFCLALVKIFILITAVYLNDPVFPFIHALFSSFLGEIAQVALLFIIAYHTITGIQHILWDFGRGFGYTLPQHRLRTIAIFSASTFLALFISFITF